jgi:hypothetical protein
MPKAIVIVALIALIAVMALPPAYSAPRECTDAHMSSMSRSYCSVPATDTIQPQLYSATLKAAK